MDIAQSAQLVYEVAAGIYKTVQKVQYFKNRSQRLSDQIESMRPTIEKLVIMQQKVSSTACPPDDTKLHVPVYSKPLGELRQLLDNIHGFLKYLQKLKFYQKILKNNQISTNFDEYREQLFGLFQTIHLGLSTEQMEVGRRPLEDRHDQENDMNELKAELQRAKEETIEEIKKHAVGQEMRKQLEELNAFLKSPIPGADDKETIIKRHGTMVDLTEIEQNQLTQMKEIAVGQFGNTFIAKYMQEDVAVKSYSATGNLEELKAVLLKEARNLLKLNSTYIVRLWGVCTAKDPYLLVFEYMAKGNLRALLDIVGPNLDELPRKNRIQMALDGALGLFRMHNMKPRPLLHQDIASDNFLVDENWKMKLSGVGFAQTQSSILKNSKREMTGRSTMSYISPERLEDAVKYLPDSYGDVYSYGIVMWEIASGSVPYQGMGNNDIYTFVSDKKKLPVPDLYPKEFIQLIDDCRIFERLERPSSFDIVTRLQKLTCSLGE